MLNSVKSSCIILTSLLEEPIMISFSRIATLLDGSKVSMPYYENISNHKNGTISELAYIVLVLLPGSDTTSLNRSH
ncbi:MAG: hypothetical protein ACJAZT_001982 [Gammaproteobacteria bacterium]|jgi:hypothetical protein